MNKRLILVDGTNLAFRQFYAIRELNRRDGFPVNAIYGFVQALWALEKQMEADRIVVCFDISKSKKRRELFPEYKANRAKTPDDIKVQLPFIKQAVKFLGHTLVEQEDVEADDIICSLANKFKKDQEIILASADKDFAQCVESSVVQAVPQPGGQWKLLDNEGVKEKFGVYPEQIIDYLSLLGDSADNIPGIPGVGQKTAAKWLQEYQDIETLFENIAKLKPERLQAVFKEHKENLLRNRELIKLENDLIVSLPTTCNLDWKNLETFLNDMELFSLLKKAKSRYGIKAEPKQAELF